MEDLSILSHFECFPFVNPNLCLKNHAVLISDSGQAWTHNYSWYNSVYSPIFGIRLCFKYYPIIITESNTFMYSKCHGVFFFLWGISIILMLNYILARSSKEGSIAVNIYPCWKLSISYHFIESDISLLTVLFKLKLISMSQEDFASHAWLKWY